LRRIDLTPGDVIIASSLAIDAFMDLETLDALLARGTDVTLPELYLLTREQPNFALYAITCIEERPSLKPRPTPSRRSRSPNPILRAFHFGRRRPRRRGGPLRNPF
jgi:hypothetical protein